MIMAPIHEGLETMSFGEPDDTEQPYVPVVTPAECTVRCVDLLGETLQEETSTEVVNREVKKAAPVIEGYVLVSEPEITITITRDPARNIILFAYEPEEPEDEEEVEEEEPGDTGEDDIPDDQGDQFDPDNPVYPPDPGDIIEENDPYYPVYPPDPGDIIEEDEEDEEDEPPEEQPEDGE
jgi:hypothetical protein